MTRVLALGVVVVSGALLLTGCATGMRGSPRHVCADAGYRPGTPEFTSCWHHVRDRMLAAETGPMLVGIAAGVVATKPPTAPTSGPLAASGGTLDQEYVSGTNRICIYSTSGGTYAMTIPAAGLCPISPR